MKACCCWLLAWLALGCSSSAETPDHVEFVEEPYAVVTSDSGALRVEVRTSPSQPPALGINSVELLVIDATDGSGVDGLDIGIIPWMASHSHGSSQVPTVTAEGNGHYVAPSLSLYMAGTWELRTTISGTMDDSLVATLDVY